MTANPSPQPEPEHESNLQTLGRWLRTVAPYAAGLAALGLALWALVAGPKWAKVFVVASIGSAIVAYYPIAHITAWLWSPDLIHLLAVDAADLDGGIELHELSEQEWADLEVEDGHKLEQIPAKAPLYLCRTFDAETLTATATWRGSKNDLELLRNEAAIDEMRNTLEPMADNYNALYATLEWVARRAINNILVHIFKSIETATMPNGDAISKAIEDAVPNDLSHVTEDGKDMDPEKIEDDATGSSEDGETDPLAEIDLNEAVRSGVTDAAESTDA
jgi:hypothetical protein